MGQAAFVFKFTFIKKKSKGPYSPQRLSVLMVTAATRRHNVSCIERNRATHSHGIEVASIPICHRRSAWAIVAAILTIH